MTHLNSENIRAALETLQLPPFVTKEEIKAQYRFLAKKFHPDKGGDNRKFGEIAEAYRLLIEYIDGFRYTFDEEEINKQLSGVYYARRFGM